MSKLRIIVTGLVGLTPVGGVAWDYLQYAVGLARLGHDVYYYENTRQWPYHPVEERLTDIPDYTAQFISTFFDVYAPGLSDRWLYCHLVDQELGLFGTDSAQTKIDEDLYISPLSNQFLGMSPEAFAEIASTADLYINISGTGVIPESLSEKCVKVFLDTDPGYNQIVLSEKPAWSKHVDQWLDQFRSYDAYFTYAENMYGGDCLVPTLGIDWQTTRMPIIMDLWGGVEVPPQDAPWTTIMTWNAFKGELIYQGQKYGSKGLEFEKIIELPRYLDTTFLVALGGKYAPEKQLTSGGWVVSDAPSETRSAQQYQDFILGSRGEISTAKNVYVAMRTGWFSCRTACYLATGRPTVVQDTGFSSIYPTGEGLMIFSDLQEAREALLSVEADYDRHAKQARALAYEYFESGKVLNDMLGKLGV